MFQKKCKLQQIRWETPIYELLALQILVPVGNGISFFLESKKQIKLHIVSVCYLFSIFDRKTIFMSRLICCEHFEEMKSWFSLKSFSSIIRQNCESQNGYFKKTNRAKCFEKPTFLTPWCAHVRALFSWNTRFEIRPFALLPTFYPIWIRQITWLWAVKSTKDFHDFFLSKLLLIQSLSGSSIGSNIIKYTVPNQI